MTQITGTESIAFASIIFENKKYITLKKELFEKNKNLFDEALKTSIKGIEAETIQNLVNAIQKDKTIKNRSVAISNSPLSW